MSAMSYQRASIFFYSLILFIAAPAWAEVYTWQDENGQQRFSDRPPETQDYQQWEPPDHPNSDLQLPEPRERSSVEPSKDDERENSTKTSSGESQQEKQEKRCRQYEAELERINNQLRAGYREPKGNRLRAKRRRLRSRQFRECM